jgi:hypothetical protein
MKLSTYEKVISDFGLDLKDFPIFFTDCFDAKTPSEKKVLSDASSGLSGMISRAMPSQLNGLDSEQIFEAICRSKKPNIYKSSMFLKIPDVFSDGIRRAIGFKIVRNLDYAKTSPTLLFLRNKIESAAKVTGACARGAHKGKATEEIMGAVGIANRHFSMLSQLDRGELISYVSERAIADNDPKAKAVLAGIFTRGRDLDWKTTALSMPTT